MTERCEMEYMSDQATSPSKLLLNYAQKQDRQPLNAQDLIWIDQALTQSAESASFNSYMVATTKTALD